MFLPFGSMKKVPGLPGHWWRRAKEANRSAPLSTPFYGVWDGVARFAAEIRANNFMAEMIRRRDAFGSEGLMGALDCATLYALTRWQRPAVVVESGGFVGMSSAFILKALVDEGLTTAKLYSIEWSEDCEQGALIPDELRPQFVPLRRKVEDFARSDALPSCIDMFLRDSGLIVSHDVHINAAFPEVVAQTYAHDKKTGRLDVQRTSHYEWGRWGYIGFAIKKS